MNLQRTFAVFPEGQSPSMQGWLAQVSDGEIEETGLSCIRYQSENGDILYVLSGLFSKSITGPVYTLPISDGYVLRIAVREDFLLVASIG